MRLFTCIALFFLLHPVSAQQLSLETYTPSNGLVDARVIKIFQDSKGRIFFLTREGFSIFDGQRFSNYGGDGNKRTEIINGITEYKDGTVRLYSFDGNIYEVKGNTVTIDSTHRKLLSEANIVIDISPDEKIIATNYLLLKEKNKTFQQISIPYGFSKMPRIDNIFWVNPYLIFLRELPTTGNTIYLYNYRSHLLVDSLTLENVSTSTSDKKGNVYFLTKEWLQLDWDALSKGKLKTMPAYFSNMVPSSFRNGWISFDNNNGLWLSNNEKGYCKLDTDNKTCKYFSAADGLLGSAGSIFQDAENNYWFISTANGVQKMQQSPLIKINRFNNISTGYVTVINSDEKGNLFVNSTNGIFLNEKKIGDYYTTADNKPFYYQNQYWHFINDRILKSSKGIQFNLPDHLPGYSPSDISPSLTCIDRKGNLLMAGNVLFVIDTTLQLHAYRLPYFCDNIVVDANNNYWCFTRSNIVIRLAWKNGELQELYRQVIPDLNPRFTILWNSTTILSGTRFEGIKIFIFKDDKLSYSGSIGKK
ncbi:MAG: hypothetical protein ABIN74_09830, partial [Ferruginibacter sp.]